MIDSPENRELLDELAPFLESARGKEEPSTLPHEDLTQRILSEHRPATRASSDSPDPLPRPFGPYELRTTLGRGGSATVYAGFDPELQREIAVKILAPELAAIDTARERFLREAQAAAQLHHDHIMPIFAVHQDTPLPCLTMPLMEGRTLQERLDFEGALAGGELARIGAELAAALQAAHESGYIHRDVKPSNVFLEAGTGRVRLMDFGLAKADNVEGLTQPGVLAGTPEYLAPEQLDGIEPAPASDLYGLGATLYTMAAGRPPFTGSSLTSLLKRIATETPPPLPPSLPPALRSLIGKLLQRDPTRRPASAMSVRERLTRIHQREDAAPNPSPSYRLIPLVWIAAVIIFAITMAYLARSHLERRAQEQQATANQEDSTGVVEVPDLAALRSALLTGSEEPLTIRISTAGAYTLPPLDLGERDVTIEAAEPGTSLTWTAGSEPNIRSAGRLVLRDLVIHQEVPVGLQPAALIDFEGSELRIDSCRLTQTRSSRSRVGTGHFIAVRSPARVTLLQCLAHLFLSSLVECRDPGAEVTIAECLAFVPRLLTSQGGGTLHASDSGFANHFSLTVENGPPALKVHAERCYLQSSYAPLWLPGAGEDAAVRDRVAWTGKGNLYSGSWLFLFTSDRPPFGRAPRGIPPEYHWLNFSDWVSFWKESESGAQQVPRPLVWPSGSGQPGTVPTEDIAKEFRKVIAEGVGVDPAKTGPFGE